jgi:PAS domain S-box-containing protein
MGAVLVFRDITERKHAEEAQARLAAIVESSQDAIVSKTFDGVILSWNAGAERLFGYAPHEAIGRPITLIIPPERQDEEQEILARIRSGERVEHYETVRVSKQGRRIDISLTISPIRDGSGRIVGASKVARDITERKRAQEALREADRRKDEFIALLAHELRNPLAPLRSGLQVLQMAAAEALAFPQSYYDDLCSAYRRRREVLLPYLEKAGFQLTAPDGAYYVMTDAAGLGATDDVEFVTRLVEKVGVAGVPGSSFYSPKELGKTKVRFMFAKREETLHEAGRRLLMARELLR